MYEINPPAVYIHERALATPERKARVERMLRHVDCRPETVDDERLNEISLGNEWHQRLAWRTGQWQQTGDPVLIFNAFTWDDPETLARRRQDYPGTAFRMLDGAAAWTLRKGRDYYGSRGSVCQDAWEVHSAFGCLHRCDYCHVGAYVNIMVNLEELVDRLPELVDANPWLQLYKYDNYTDTIAFEPEYGASALMVPFFAATEDKYLMLYTKSDNVDHLLPLEHGGHTIVSFTISSTSVAELIEHATPGTPQRIAAAAKVERAGYVPRVRFSPIVPIKGWRDELAALVDDLLDACTPDLITIDLLGWMNPEAVGETLDTSLLDPRFLDGMTDLYSDGPPGKQYYPNTKHIFPHDLRREVYDFVIQRANERKPEVVMSICNETTQMWDDIGETLAMTPEDYVCGCGPTSVPGNPIFARG